MSESIPAARKPSRRFSELTPMASRLASDGMTWSTRTAQQCTGACAPRLLPMHQFAVVGALAWLHRVDVQILLHTRCILAAFHTAVRGALPRFVRLCLAGRPGRTCSDCGGVPAF